MVQHCPRCQRANPSEAVFCFHDGCLLQQSGAAAAGTFLQEFVFPSGRRCRSFDEFVQGIYADWEDARDLLADGTFVSFLAGLGRGDLVRFAREAQAQSDRDIALTNFVAALPATQVQGPRLGLSPRRLVVGPMRVDEQRAGQVRLINEGQGVLQGKITVAEGAEWLRLADSKEGQGLAVHAAREQTVALRIETAGLVVGQNYSGKLIVVSNGGIAEVPIRLDLTARAFGRTPYQGAMSPHELARKMRDNPHPAVSMLESGEIARWFRSNGWTYPIAGVTAPGLAAVQQFFEELGLARAPQILVSQQEYRLSCRPPDVRHEEVIVRSPARKLVHARAESDEPWLNVTTPNVSGQVQVAIDFSIDSSLMPEDRVYEGTLKVIANAGQTFPIRVVVEVQGNKKRGRTTTAKPASATAMPTAVATAPTTMSSSTIPVAAIPTATPVVANRAGEPTTFGEMIYITAMLGFLLRLVFLLPSDIYARLLATGGGSPTPGSMAAWLEMPAPDLGYLRHLAVAVWWVGSVVGVILVWRGGGRWVDLLFGALAGAVAGIISGVILGTIVAVGDTLPREVLGRFQGAGMASPPMATPLWFATTLMCWMLLGGVLGFVLGLGGRAGRRLLARAANPLSRSLRALGLARFAEMIELRV